LEFARNGSEEKLRAVTNTSFGLPYLSKALESTRVPDELKRRARSYNKRGEVPIGVRFLMTTIDVQKSSFVCHTFGFAPVLMAGGAWSWDIYHVDMWKIEKSERLDEDGHPLRISPGSYKEDWHHLVPVIERTYPLADGSGRRMEVKLIASDSGGPASEAMVRLNAALKNGPVVSTTSNAYDFWRWLKTEGRLLHHRFHLLKGEPSRTNPALQRTFPDAQNKDKWAIARGDVPVWKINSNVVKDQVSGMLGRDEPGGQVHFPVWWQENGEIEDIDWLYKQLTSETRTTTGWKNLSRKRNEAFDLLSYAVAFTRHDTIRLDNIDWMTPPSWAEEWDKNDMVFLPAGSEEVRRIAVKEVAEVKPSIENLAELLG
jgi:phage terminase large subunit GpA-like protein